jgi:hypothetical protein
MTDMPHPEPGAAADRRRRMQLVMLALVFMAPVIAAWIAWQYVGEHGVGATTNAGQLIVPPRPLSLAGLLDADGQPVAENLLRGRWTYVILAPTGCAEHCEQQLLETRQVRISVNKDLPRVQRLLLLAAPPSPEMQAALRQAHPELLLAVLPAGDTPAIVGAVGGAGVPVDGAHVLLVDPLGNLMMSYGPEVPAKGVLKDLRKLLKASQIG